MASHLYIGIIAPATILLPIVAGCARLKKTGKSEWYLLIYLFVAAIINTTAILLAFKRINNLPLLHLLTAIELPLVLLFFLYATENRKITRYYPYIGIGFMLFCMANALWLQGIHTFNSYAKGAEAILIISAAILFFLYSNNEKDKAVIFFVAGLLFYFTGSYLLFLFANYLKPGYRLSTVVWNINATLSIIMYLLFTIGFIKCNRQTTNSTFS